MEPEGKFSNHERVYDNLPFVQQSVAMLIASAEMIDLEWMCRRESSGTLTFIRSLLGGFVCLAARSVPECGHSASEGRQAAGAFAFDQRLEGFSKKRGLLFHTGEFLGGTQELVIERNGRSHLLVPSTGSSIA